MIILKHARKQFFFLKIPFYHDSLKRVVKICKYLAYGANPLVALGPSSKAAAAVPGYVRLGIFLLMHNS